MKEEPASPATGGARGTEHPTDEKKIVEHYPPPEPEPPPPTFRQALIGYGSVFLALVALGLLIGLLMRVLR